MNRTTGKETADGPNDHLHVPGFTQRDIAMLKAIANEASRQTMRDMLTMMGLDPDQPLEMQRAFVLLRETVGDPEFRADQGWTRRTRRRMEGVVGKAIMTVVALAVVSAGQTMWAGLQALLPPQHR